MEVRPVTVHFVTTPHTQLRGSVVNLSCEKSENGIEEIHVVRAYIHLAKSQVYRLPLIDMDPNIYTISLRSPLQSIDHQKQTHKHQHVRRTPQTFHVMAYIWYIYPKENLFKLAKQEHNLMMSAVSAPLTPTRSPRLGNCRTRNVTPPRHHQKRNDVEEQEEQFLKTFISMKL